MNEVTHRREHQSCRLSPIYTHTKILLISTFDSAISPLYPDLQSNEKRIYMLSAFVHPQVERHVMTHCECSFATAQESCSMPPIQHQIRVYAKNPSIASSLCTVENCFFFSAKSRIVFTPRDWSSYVRSKKTELASLMQCTCSNVSPSFLSFLIGLPIVQ